MKKIASFAAIAALLFVSCKKEQIDQPVDPSKPTISLATTGNPQTIVAGPEAYLGSLALVVGDLQDPKVYGNFSIDTDLPAGKVRKFYYVLRNGNEVIYVSPQWNTILPLMIDGTADVTPGAITADFYADITPGVSGTIFVKANFDWTALGYVNKRTQTVSTPVTTVVQYKSMPVLSFEEIIGVRMVNNVQQDAYHNLITNNGVGRISNSEFTYEVNIVDANNNDSITGGDFELWIDGVNRSADVLFLNDTGAIITHLSEGTSLLRIPFVTGTRELGTDPGEEHEMLLRFTPKGLVNNGNAITFRLISDDNFLSQGPFYLNTVIGAWHLRLTQTQSASTPDGYIPNLPWCEVGPSFIAIPGGTQEIYNNGFGIASLPIQGFHQ